MKSADTIHQLLDPVLVVLIIAYASLTVTVKILEKPVHFPLAGPGNWNSVEL